MEIDENQSLPTEDDCDVFTLLYITVLYVVDDVVDCSVIVVLLL